MKTLTKIANCWLALVFALSMAFVPVAMADDVTPAVTNPALANSASSQSAAPSVVDNWQQTYVIDIVGSLDDEGEPALNETAQGIAREKGVGVYLVFMNSFGDAGGRSAVDALYKQYNMGTGDKGNAMVFAVAVEDEEYFVNLYGNATSAISESSISRIRTDVTSYLDRHDWQGAAQIYYDDATAALAAYTYTTATSSIADMPYTEGTYVIDEYNLFNDTQRSTLEAKAQELAAKYKMGVYLLVVDDIGHYSRTNYATEFYRTHNLGYGSNKDGILFMIAVDSRDYVTIAYGQGSYSFSDEGIDEMEDAVVDQLKNNNWYGASEKYYENMESQLAYYEKEGKAYVPKDPFGLIIGLLAALGIPGFVARGVVGNEESAMKTAHEQTGAANYFDRNSLVLTHSSDEFVNTTLVATPIPEHDDSDSGGGGFSGGGGWGGGGGGGFSSSGGGKF